MAETCDVLILGGGIMGVSAAFWLTRMGAGRVVIVEPDPSLARSSTALSVASIRQQFTTKVNVEISLFGAEFLRYAQEYMAQGDIAAPIRIQPNGYLFLAGSDDAACRMREAVEMQRTAGAGTRLVTPGEIGERFPHIRTDDVVLGSLGTRDEGWFDSMALHAALKSAAKAQGVSFRRDRAVAARRTGAFVTGVTLADGGEVAVGQVVNAMGTNCAALMGWLDEDVPVEPRKRTVFVVDVPKARYPDAPLLIDHSGVYSRPECEAWLAAVVPDDDGPADPEDFDPDWHLFEDVIWHRLWHRMPDFAEAKVRRAWAGHYAFNTLDQNAIVGRWPTLDNLYLLNGFSGHGLQQAPAMGRGIAELITSGQFRTLDLSDLGTERIVAGQPFREYAIV